MPVGHAGYSGPGRLQSVAVVTKKAERPGAARRQPAGVSAVSRPRAGTQRLAPEHVGELGSVALLAMAVVGIALVMVGLAMAVSGLTIDARYADPPPNVGQLGLAPLLGGIGLAVLGVVHLALAAAVLAEMRHARSVAAGANAFTAALAVIAVVLVMGQSATPDRVLATSLVVMAVVFGAASIVLFRRR
jgi:hypothetical protein